MSMEWFFWWNEMPLDDEIADDVRSWLTNPKGNLFYDRSYGSALAGSENTASRLLTQIGGRFSVVEALAERNTRVSDGTTDAPDRRVATSQSVISVRELEDGGIEVEALYIPTGNVQNPQTIRTPIGER